VDGVSWSRTDVTVINTSTNGWMVHDKKPPAASEHEDSLAKEHYCVLQLSTEKKHVMVYQIDTYYFRW
jgi:hypothetical protein